MKVRFLKTLMVGAVCTCAAFARGADKPNVLIIGDSISLGYTPYVIKMIGDKASVVHNEGNAGSTGRGLAGIDSWVGTSNQWAVIHFNWGLWDICHRVGGKRDLSGPIAAQLPEYEQNLDALVTKMKQLAPGAVLIWAPITNVTGGWGRVKGDDVTYNAAAEKVMKKQGVIINDLHAVSAAFPPELYKSPGNVHFTEEGYQKLAEQVTAAIEKALAEKAK